MNLFSKERIFCKPANKEKIFFFVRVRKWKGGKEENAKVASPESVPIHLNPVALRKAKIIYNFGLTECNRINNVLISKKRI